MRWRWRILIALGLLPFIAAVTLWFAIDSAPVRAWLAATIVEAASSPGEMELAIEDLGPGLPGSINVGAVTLADSQGVWLRIDKVAIDWNPWALIGGRVAVDALTLGSVTVLREPLPSPDAQAATEPDASADFSLPQAPGIAISIGRLEVASIALDAALLGTPASYSLEGRADLDEGGAGALVLDLDRTDGTSGRFALRFDVDLASDSLAISADIEEGQDGLIVHLADLAPYPAFSATLAAKGSVDDWDGTLSLVLAETADADVNFGVRSQEEGFALKVSGTTHIAGMLDAQTAALLGDALDFDADVVLAGQLLTLNAVEIAAEPATVKASGRVDLDALSLDLKVDAAGEQTTALAGLTAPLTFHGWTITGDLSGSAQAPSFAGVVTMAQPEAEGMGAADVRLEVEELHLGEDGAISLAALLALQQPSVGDALAEAQLGSAPTLRVRGTVDAAFEAIDLSIVELDLAAGHLRTALALDTTDGAIAVRGLDADLPLAPLSTLAGLDLAGKLAVSGDVDVSGWGESASGSLRLDASGLSTGQAILDAITGDAPGIALELSGGADRIVVSAATVDLPIWNAKGDFDIDLAAGTMSGRLSGSFQTTRALAAEIDPALQGAGTLGIVAKGSLEAPIMDIRLAIAKGAYDTIPLDGAVVDMRGLDISSGLTSAMRVTLPSGSSELAAETRLVFDADFANLAVQDLRAAGPGINAGGALTMDLARSQIDGRIAGQLTDLAALSQAMALGSLAGIGVFEATFIPADDGGQTVEAKTWIEQVDLEGLGIGELAVAATVEDAMGKPVLDVRGSFAGMDLMDVATADKMLVTLKGGLDALDITLQARGSGGPGWTFDTNARVGLGDAASTVTVARLELTSGEHRVATTDVVNVTLDRHGITTDKLSMVLDGGTLDFNAAMGDEDLKGDLTIAKVPLSLLEMIDPALQMHGQFDGTATFDVNPTSGEAKASFTGSGLKLQNAALDEEAQLTMDATWHGQRLSVVADITGIQGLTGSLKADWPLTFDPRSGAVEVPVQEQVSADVTLKGDIARLWQHLPVGDQLLSGQADVALTVSGVAADPSIQGKASLDGGRYENLEWGTVIDHVRLDAASTQDGGLQLTLNADDGAQGKITVSGLADLNQYGNLELDAKLTLDDARLVQRDDAKLVARGDLTFKGALSGGDIVGRFQTVEVDINVAQSLPSNVTVLNAQDAFLDKLGNGSPSPVKPWNASLDIEVDMPGKVRVHGRGLETDWSGKISVTGTVNEPLVSAKLNLQRGTLDIIGRRFTLTTGSVELVPEDHGDPRFNVVAAIDSGDVNGQMEVSGRMSAPQLKVTTVPPLPEDEALARLMFGKGTGSLSGIEALQLASAISEITGTTGGGSGVLDSFRNTLGVDVLDVGTDSDGNMTVGAGRYLSDGVYVGVEQGASANSSGVVVNIELTDNLNLETEAGADSSGRVGVDWKWDY